jgi:hypothetical protein
MCSYMYGRGEGIVGMEGTEGIVFYLERRGMNNDVCTTCLMPDGRINEYKGH